MFICLTALGTGGFLFRALVIGGYVLSEDCQNLLGFISSINGFIFTILLMAFLMKYSKVSILQMTFLMKYSKVSILQMTLLVKYSKVSILQITFFMKYSKVSIPHMTFLVKYSMVSIDDIPHEALKR